MLDQRAGGRVPRPPGGGVGRGGGSALLAAGQQLGVSLGRGGSCPGQARQGRVPGTEIKI